MSSDPPCRVLIVDDSPEDREVYKRMLAQDREHDYEFLEADLGEEGLRLAQDERPARPLPDDKLPAVDGLAFLTRLPQQTLRPVITPTRPGSRTARVGGM